jgi:hypothetical protein
MYKAFAANCRFTSAASAPHIRFMGACVVEAYGAPLLPLPLPLPLLLRLILQQAVPYAVGRAARWRSLPRAAPCCTATVYCGVGWHGV